MFRSFFILILPVLAVMAANPANSTSSPPPPSVTETCSANYAGSSAKDTCYNESFKEVNSSTCRIAANCYKSRGFCTVGVDCLPAEQTNVFSAIELDPANAGSVENCDGQLKLGC